jgi:glycosyltransferase involved in cell wall biosynthesis
MVLAARVEGDPPRNATVVTIPNLVGPELEPSVGGLYSNALAEFGPDVVHVHSVKDPPLLVALTRRHAPIVWGVHDYSATCPSGSLHFRPGHECGRAYGPGCLPAMALRGCWHSRDPRALPTRYRESGRSVDLLRKVDVALAVSSFMRRNLERNGVFAAEARPFVTGPIRQRPPGLADRVLFVGRLTHSKGLGPLLRALAQVEATLDVCGEGWWGPAARRMASRLGVDDRVQFLGWLSPSELDAAYERAAVVAVPSLWPEPFGMVGIEAMARGRPVVASRTGGIPDWLVDGQTGMLTRAGDVCQLTDALCALLEDPGLRARMGAEGARRCRRSFTAEAHLAALERVHVLARDRWARRPEAAVGA